MAETPVPRMRAMRTKLTLADFPTPPAMIKTMTAQDLAKAGGRLVMGRYVGIATGFVVRTKPDKSETFEGLKGQFRLIPADPEKDEVESGVCFFPDAYHNMIAGGLRTALKAFTDENGKEAYGDPNGSVQFGFEVSAIPAKNPQGYSWQFLPLLPPKVASPLDHLVGEIASIKTPQLAGPKR